MNFDSIQSNWNQSSATPKSREELQQISHIKHDPKVRRLRVKFVIEVLLVTVFLVVFYNAFDGDTKPLWANFLLVASAVAYLITRFFGGVILRNPIKGNNLKASIHTFRQQLKLTALSVLITSFVFGGSVIVFFTSTISFTPGKYFFLAGMVATLVIFVYWAGRVWRERLKQIGELLEEMEE